MLAADATGVTVDLRLPRPRFEVGAIDGVVCAIPRLAALAGRAAPSPSEAAYGWLMGVPEPDGAAVRVSESVSVSVVAPGPLCSDLAIMGRAPLTVGRTLGEVRDTGAVPAPADWPGLPDTREPVAGLEPVGELRGQGVARLVVRPLARADDGGLVFRMRLRLRIGYRQPASVRLVPAGRGDFAPAYGTLLNAAALPRRRDDAGGRLPSAPIGARALAAAEWTAPATHGR